MTISEQIKALPDDGYIGLWDGNEYEDPMKTDELKALTESHERLLRLAKETLEYDYYPPGLEDAIEQAENFRLTR